MLFRVYLFIFDVIFLKKTKINDMYQRCILLVTILNHTLLYVIVLFSVRMEIVLSSSSPGLAQMPSIFSRPLQPPWDIDLLISAPTTTLARRQTDFNST